MGQGSRSCARAPPCRAPVARSPPRWRQCCRKSQATVCLRHGQGHTMHKNAFYRFLVLQGTRHNVQKQDSSNSSNKKPFQISQISQIGWCWLKTQVCDTSISTKIKIKIVSSALFDFAPLVVSKQTKQTKQPKRKQKQTKQTDGSVSVFSFHFAEGARVNSACNSTPRANVCCRARRQRRSVGGKRGTTVKSYRKNQVTEACCTGYSRTNAAGSPRTGRVLGLGTKGTRFVSSSCPGCAVAAGVSSTCTSLNRPQSARNICDD